ncbi:MAG: response regulator [bacterium]|nr:response regulator [bacterium]
MNIHILRFVLLTIILFPSQELNSAPEKTGFILSDNSSSLENIVVLPDKDESFTIDTITSVPNRNKFLDNRIVAKQYPFRDLRRMVFWGKIAITNNSQKTPQWVLEDATMHTGRSIELYVNTEKGWEKKRSINDAYRNFIITIPYGETKEYYFKFTLHSYSVDFSLSPVPEFMERSQHKSIFYGILIGIIIIMAFYNLFLFFSFKEKSYIYYISFIICYGMLSLIMSGVLYEIFPWFDSKVTLFHYTRSFTLATLVLFGGSLLNFNYYLPKGRKFLYTIIMIMLLCTFIFGIKAEVLINILFINGTITLYSMAIIIWLKKFRPAKYFIAATSLFLIAMSLYPISYLDGTPFSLSDLIQYRLLDNTGLVMIFLFSLALADRINIIKEEKEEAQVKAIENLKKADLIKDEFLSNTSHELRTPLNGIIGLTESLVEGAKGPIPEAIKKNLELVAVSGKRLSNLVNDILDYSRLKNKEIQISRNSVNLKALADVVLELCEPLKREKDLLLKNSIPPSTPRVQGDEVRLQQIFFNLLGNSIKFTESGTITISASLQEEDPGLIEVSVSDTGIGIPPEKQESIFQSFEQADGSISRKYGGTGIGLSIVKQLVELHGGAIRVESQENTGARFIFTLPVSEQQNREEKTVRKISGALRKEEPGPGYPVEIPPEIPSPEGAYKGTLLAVDDDPVNLQVVVNYLSVKNYRVVTATDGGQALEMIQEKGKNNFDLVLLDIMMPKISGFEVCRTIRKNFTLFELPVIILTARNNVEDLTTGFEAGANDYLSKPFNKEELISRVETLVALHKTVNNLREAHFTLLQERMDPHFLFNALHSINSLTITNPDKVSDAICMMADNYRFLMDHSNKSMIGFNEEWEFVKNYLGMEKLRFAKLLRIDMRQEGDFNGVKIPPLVIQPLVENSIKHGLKGEGIINIFARRTGDEVYIEIRDNGTGILNKKIYSRSLGNISIRLKHYYRDATLDARNNDEGGALVTITFTV